MPVAPVRPLFGHNRHARPGPPSALYRRVADAVPVKQSE